MKSRNRSYIPQVDELRAIAALLVFFFHCLVIGYWKSGHQGWMTARNPLEALLIEGHSGVSLFMVLSGYILARGVWDKPLRYSRFIANRVIRIAPLMTILVVAAAYSTKTVTIGQIAAPFLLLQNVPSLALNDPSNLTGTVWTIAIEFQFYLVAPFLFVFVRRHGLLGYVLPFGVFVLLLRCFILAENQGDASLLWQFPYFTIVGRINQFIVGIYIAERWDHLAAWTKGRKTLTGTCLASLGLLGMVVLSFVENRGGGQYAWHWWRLPQQEMEAVFWAAVMAGYITADPLRGLRRTRLVVRFIGVISFSIYLLHWPILQGVYAAMAYDGIAAPATRLGLVGLAAGGILPIVLIVSALSYASVERPFLLLRTRYTEAVPGRTVTLA